MIKMDNSFYHFICFKRNRILNGVKTTKRETERGSKGGVVKRTM